MSIYFQGFIGKASIFMFLSALMHLIAPILGGFSTSSFILVPIAVLYGGLGYLLMRGFRWAAWINYLILLAFIPLAYGLSNSGSVPYFWNIGIIIIDLFAFLFLFLYLFQSKKQENQ